jgi:hypothetical protein
LGGERRTMWKRSTRKKKRVRRRRMYKRRRRRIMMIRSSRIGGMSRWNGMRRRMM